MRLTGWLRDSWPCLVTGTFFTPPQTLLTPIPPSPDHPHQDLTIVHGQTIAAAVALFLELKRMQLY